MNRLTDIKLPSDKYYNRENGSGENPGQKPRKRFTPISSSFRAIGRGLRHFFIVLPKRPINWIILLLVLIFLWQLSNTVNFPTADPGRWQAVTLDSNQLYFGHLKDLNDSYILLTDVYYLKANPAGTQPPVSLFKLTNEIYGPDGNLYIPKNKILYWDNLQENSQAVQAINQISSR